MAEGIANSRTDYTLGFYLGELDGKYHELKVVVNRRGLELNHRLGYIARTDAKLRTTKTGKRNSNLR